MKEELLKCIKDIERYADDLRTVSIGYAMSLKNLADDMKRIIEGEYETD